MALISRSLILHKSTRVKWQFVIAILKIFFTHQNAEMLPTMIILVIIDNNTLMRRISYLNVLTASGFISLKSFDFKPYIRMVYYICKYRSFKSRKDETVHNHNINR